MTPTMHLRFIERLEIVYSAPGDELSTARKVRVLQQFWEHPNGKEAAGDMFRIVMGTWRDVPLETKP